MSMPSSTVPLVFFGRATKWASLSRGGRAVDGVGGVVVVWVDERDVDALVDGSIGFFRRYAGCASLSRRGACRRHGWWCCCRKLELHDVDLLVIGPIGVFQKSCGFDPPL